MEALRRNIRKIFQAALSSVDPYKAVYRHLILNKNTLLLNTGSRSTEKRLDLRQFKRIFVLGAGKAAVPMAAACEELFHQKIFWGFVVTKYGHSKSLRTIEVLESGHPVPDAASLQGARKILTTLTETQKKDLVIFLTSGGCSALLAQPVPPITLMEKKKLTRLLLQSGANIQEMNAVRKHLSLIKGGNLAKAAYPSTVINLILSDVVGDELDVIGSGPFVPDPSTFQEVWEVIEKYALKSRLSKKIVRHLSSGVEGRIEETPKAGQPYFRNVSNLIIGNNLTALKSAAVKARGLGYKTYILTSQLQGEAREIAKIYAAIAREIIESGHPFSPPVCILAGGEPTVTIKGKGLGGRNTELALAVAIGIKNLNKTAFLSGGTDGTDGPTDAAGAIVIGHSYQKAIQRGLRPEDYLRENDSYSFFKNTGELLVTGPTGTNVMDIHVLLAV